MNSKPERDMEKAYPLPEFIAKLRRLADALEQGKRFEIRIAGETISVPVRAICNIEHEREGASEEIEFQIKWENPQRDYPSTSANCSRHSGQGAVDAAACNRRPSRLARSNRRLKRYCTSAR